MWTERAEAIRRLIFEHYGKSDDLRHLMERWLEAAVRVPAFMQQMNPWTG